MKKLGAGSFQLEPDGFSIHTLEIVKKLSNKEYKRIRDSISETLTSKRSSTATTTPSSPASTA